MKLNDIVNTDTYLQNSFNIRMERQSPYKVLNTAIFFSSSFIFLKMHCFPIFASFFLVLFFPMSFHAHWLRNIRLTAQTIMDIYQKKKQDRRTHINTVSASLRIKFPSRRIERRNKNNKRVANDSFKWLWEWNENRRI